MTKQKVTVLVIWVILSFLEAFRQNTQSPARVNIHGLHSAAHQFVAVSSHPLAVSHCSGSLLVPQSLVTQAQVAHPGGVHSAGVHSSCHSSCFV